MNEKKENPYGKLIDETLNSIQFIKRAEPGEEVISRILAAKASAKIITVRPLTKWAVAASIVILFGLNVWSAVHYRKNDKAQNNPVYTEYFSYFQNF
jgi:hypothetical protein